MKLLGVLAMVAVPVLANAECGWLLMVPITMPGVQVIREAPLAEWYQYGAFDTAASCDDARVSTWKRATQSADATNKVLAVAMPNARCLPASQVPVR
jgi:hypothetical protein